MLTWNVSVVCRRVQCQHFFLAVQKPKIFNTKLYKIKKRRKWSQTSSQNQTVQSIPEQINVVRVIVVVKVFPWISFIVNLSWYQLTDRRRTLPETLDLTTHVEMLCYHRGPTSVDTYDTTATKGRYTETVWRGHKTADMWLCLSSHSSPHCVFIRLSKPTS